MKETDKAYLAGFVDGEGSIGIDRIKSKGKVVKYTFKVRVVITNSDFETMKWIKQITGYGCAYKYKKAYNPKWKQVHRWQVVSKKAKEFIEEIYPYLKIKKNIAKLVISLPTNGKGLWKKDRKIFMIQYQKQNKIYQRAKELNHRGLPVVD
jgi:hypothetical protein